MFGYNLESGGKRKRITIQVSQWGCVTNKKHMMKRDAVTLDSVCTCLHSWSCKGVWIFSWHTWWCRDG